jgi:AraC-like DNA-binding protein
LLGTFDNWYEIVRRTLAREGVDLAAELATRGIARPAARAGRLPIGFSREVWQVVDQVSGDPVFGLSMLQDLDFADFDELGVALVASVSVDEMVHRMVDYHQLLTGSIRMRLEEESGMIGISLDNDGPVDWHGHEFTAGVIVRVIRARFGKAISPLQVDLAYKNDAGRDAYERYFRCAVETGAEETVLLFDPSFPARELGPSQVRVARRLEGLLQAELDALTKELSLSSMVQGEIVGALGPGLPTLDEVASAFNMSSRTLQRRLADEGRSFNDVVESARRDLAHAWVTEGELSITEIAYLLGFGSSSAFGRAYKRWFGEPPSAAWRANRSPNT